jgi:hypothetical protein
MSTEIHDYQDLVEQLGDPATRNTAYVKLHEVGRDAVGAAREGLSHPNWRVRQFSAMFLDDHWDDAALKRLILNLHDPKLKVRKAAVHSLGCDRCKNGENPIDVLPLVAERIREDKSIKVRRAAVLTLIAQTPNRRIARVLRCVLRDETDPKIRRYANYGLKRYDEAMNAAAAQQPASN